MSTVSYFLKYIYQISASFCFLLSPNILEMLVEYKRIVLKTLMFVNRGVKLIPFP